MGEQQLYRIPCQVKVESHKDLRDAELEIDGKLFSECKEPRKKSDEEVRLHPDVVKIQYQIEVPRKVRQDRAPLMTSLKTDLAAGLGLLSSIGRGSGVGGNSPRPSGSVPAGSLGSGG